MIEETGDTVPIAYEPGEQVVSTETSEELRYFMEMVVAEGGGKNGAVEGVRVGGNKKVTRYTYRVTNYKCEGEVYANLFIYRGKVVACDLTNADAGGFVIPMTLVERGNLK